MSGTPRQILVRYSVAVAAVIVVTILKHFVINLLVGDQQWFLLYVAAICLSSWYGGFGPGIVTATLSALSAAIFFTSPNNDLTAPASLFQLMLFLLEGLLVVGLTGNLRENRMAAEKDERTKDEALALLDSFQVYAPVGLAFFDNDLRYIRINYAMAELDGLTPAAHIGRTLQEIQPTMRPDLIAGIQEVLDTGKPLLDQELTVIKPTMLGMRKQHLMTSYYRIRSLDGQSMGVGAVMVDMTQYKQSEEAVRESEARFRTMADTAPVMIWLAETNKLRTYFNRVWFDFTGRTAEQDYGNGWTENLHPDDVKPYLEVYTTAFDARQEFNTEYRLRRKDGEYRWLISHGVPRFTPEGQFAGYIGISVDITERKRLEIVQEFVLQTGVVLSSSLDYETTIANVARLAVPTMADWCAVDILAPDGKSLERIAVTHINPEKVKWAYELQQRYPVNLSAETGVAEVIRSGKTQFTPEITEAMIKAAAIDADMYQILVDIGFTSVITTPLIARGRTIGVLTLVSAESKRHYTRTDVTTAEQLGVRMALAVDNARLFREAQDERERFRVTLASIGDAVIATDHAGQVTFINQIAANLTGWSSGDVLGTPLNSIFKIVNEETRQTVESPVDKVLREGHIVGLANHTVLISKSGEETPIDDSGAPIPGENGAIGGVVLVFRDVSERKREEQRQEFLVEASQLLSSSLDYETTLSNVVKLAVPTMADWCAVDMLTPQGAIKRVNVAHVDPDKIKWAYEVQKRFPPTLDAPNGVGLVMRTGETEFVEDVPALIAPIYDRLSDEMKQVMDTLQSVSVITTPLKARGVTIGALTFATAESGRQYKQTDVLFAETLAIRASLAIENSQLYGEAQDERERFRVTLASIGDAVIATNHKGEVTFLNQIATNLTGWSQDEAIGSPLSSIFKIINEVTRETVESPVDRVLQEGRIVGLANHTVLISKTGEEIPIDDSGSPIPDEDDSISGVVLVFRDVRERKQEEHRQQFLTAASKALISSLDYDTTLQQVTQLAVPTMADGCAVYLTQDDGSIQQVAYTNVNPESAKIREDLMQHYPMPQSRDYGYPKVIRTGESELLENVSDSILQAAATNAEHLELLRKSSYQSSISVPLKTQDETFGALTFNSMQGGRTFNGDDLALAEELARIASLAIENARLYRQARNR